MNSLIENYIEKKEKEKAEKRLEAKKELAAKLGIFEKEYSPNNEYSEKYPEYEFDNETQSSKYYKKIPVEITEEEYQALLKYQSDEDNSKSNTVSTVFRVLGSITFVVTAIAAIVIGSSGSTVEAISMAITGFVSGMVYIGFAEIIQLLNDIKNKP